MQVSVVVPTLNGRDRLAGTLDALADHAPDAEVIVANGPSTDGTTGMVRDRDDADVLLEVATRTPDVARNAGVDAASGDVVAFLDDDVAVAPGWRDAVVAALSDADAPAAVTGPTRRQLQAGVTADAPESRRVDGRVVTLFDDGNVALRRETLAELDGFDEAAAPEADRDAALRLARLGRRVAWAPDMEVCRDYGADGGADAPGETARARTYRLVKNCGVRAAAAAAPLPDGLSAARAATRRLVRGETEPTGVAGACRAAATGAGRGLADGLVARARDRTPARNPHGVSRRDDRVVERYDWR